MIDLEALLHSRCKDGNLFQGTPCWEWQGPLVKGYGYCYLLGARYATHRLGYTLRKGRIPPGYHIDHLCRNPKCCNPDHLEAVTSKVNTQRGRNHNREKTHCRNGHEYSAANTILLARGERQCRTCNRESKRRRKNVCRQEAD